jgi:hypothetical protein
MKKAIRNTTAGLLALAGVTCLTGCNRNNSDVSLGDINGDSFSDIVISTNKDPVDDIYLMGNSEGTYTPAKLVLNDGFGFLKTEKGFYDFKGNYFPFYRD